MVQHRAMLTMTDQ